jgi:ABC-type transport system involved in cytochrome c biogenesis permease subunit
MPAWTWFELAIALAYLAGAALYPLGLGLRQPLCKKAASLASALGFLLHTADLAAAGLLQADVLQHGQFYISLLAWLCVLVFFVAWWRFKHDFLSLITAPLAVVLFTGSMVIHPATTIVPEHLSLLWFGLHVGAIFVALALLALAFGAGVGYVYLERKIKTKSKIPSALQEMPALDTLDRVNALAVSVGFPLYSISMLSGFIWAAFTWKRVLTGDPKEVVSLGIWVLYAILFHQRLALGWKGRKPAKMAIAIFLLSLGSLVLINFLLPTHHSLRAF